MDGMNFQFTERTVSQALPSIMWNLLKHGVEVGSRNGRVKELLNAQIVLSDPTRREVLSLNRKANVFAQIAETMWVISGRDDVEWLSAYLPRAMDYSDDGETWRGGYGPRIRRGHFGFDQLQHVVSLLKSDPLSRRAVIAIYDPDTDAAPGKDVPCNDFLQFQSRGGQLHLTVTVRSNDAMWGWSGINAFEWSTLQEMVASLLGIEVGQLVFNIGSLHLYEQHWDKARRIEHESIKYPTLRFNPDGVISTVDDLDLLIDRWFIWEKLCRAGGATPDLLDDWEEPLFEAWAAAIAYYWQREDHWIEWLEGSALGVAIARTPASVLPEPRVASRSSAPAPVHTQAMHERTGAFYHFATDLHAEKHASYGDSWKKRGEKMSILANMARKVDRLGVGDSFDSSADTVIDLLIYSIKYRCWLAGQDEGPVNVNLALAHYLGETEEMTTEAWALDITIADVMSDFDYYADNLDGLSVEQKIEFVTELMARLTPIARDLWHAEQDTDDYRPDLGQ